MFVYSIDTGYTSSVEVRFAHAGIEHVLRSTIHLYLSDLILDQLLPILFLRIIDRDH